jgi:hypothetical protein
VQQLAENGVRLALETGHMPAQTTACSTAIVAGTFAPVQESATTAGTAAGTLALSALACQIAKESTTAAGTAAATLATAANAAQPLSAVSTVVEEICESSGASASAATAALKQPSRSQATATDRGTLRGGHDLSRGFRRNGRGRLRSRVACGASWTNASDTRSNLVQVAATMTEARAVMLEQAAVVSTVTAIAGGAISRISDSSVVEQPATVAEQTRATSAAAVTAAIVAGFSMEKPLAATRAAQGTPALGANPLHMADQPVNRTEGHASRAMNGTRVVFCIFAVRNRRRLHDVAGPIVHRQSFAWDRVMEDSIGPRLKRGSIHHETAQCDRDRHSLPNAGTHGHSLMTSRRLPPGVSWSGPAMVGRAVLCAPDALLVHHATETTSPLSRCPSLKNSHPTQLPEFRHCPIGVSEVQPGEFPQFGATKRSGLVRRRIRIGIL